MIMLNKQVVRVHQIWWAATTWGAVTFETNLPCSDTILTWSRDFETTPGQKELWSSNLENT